MTIRILVVDDSVVIRKLLTATLAEVSGMEVVASAAQGKIALAKIPEVHPDIVILDVEMPEMDGIETVKRIRKEWPRLPVIMFSTRTERGAVATIEALTSGASDYVTKPSNAGNVLVAMQRVRDELVPKIQALTARPSAAPPAVPDASATPTRGTVQMSALTPPAARSTAIAMPALSSPPAARSTAMGMSALPPPAARSTAMGMSALTPPAARSTAMGMSALTVTTPVKPIAPIAARTTSGLAVTDLVNRAGGARPPVDIVAIGASTGGPNALTVLLTALPADFPVPIVIVQHMLATFTRHFAERLAAQCQIKIVEAREGDALLPGHAYIARGDYHLVVERRAGRGHMALNQNKVENFCRPAVDVLFRSVASSYGAGALAVVLTGMGQDGLLGCGAIREAGGAVLVQDESSSVVWGMPGFVAKAGLANEVMPLDLLGGEVRRRVALGGPRVGAAP